jgi:hypothetical protein
LFANLIFVNKSDKESGLVMNKTKTKEFTAKEKERTFFPS